MTQPQTPDFADIVAILERRGEQAIQPGLERMQRVMTGWVSSSLPTQMIHVAGTNGKGSTSYFLYHLLQRQGLKVGLYTSPHLNDLTERIRWGCHNQSDVLIHRTDFVDLYCDLQVFLDKNQLTLSYFETITAIAIQWLGLQNLDACIWEVGLGGRWDATNVLACPWSILTNVDLDHQSYLGDTVEAIFEEKAGILKPGQRMVSAVEQLPLRQRLALLAQQKGALVELIDMPSLLPFRDKNFRLAKACFEVMGYVLDEAHLRDVDKHVVWGGRLEWLTDQICIDGAHNPAGIRALVQEITTWQQPVTLVLGILNRKDYHAMVQEIVPYVQNVWLVEGFDSQQVSTQELQKECLKYLSDVTIITLSDLQQSIAHASNVCVVAGSLYLISQVRRWWR